METFQKAIGNDYEEEMFKAAEVCHICGQQYTGKDIRVRDHCHVTGQYRGSAYQDFNVKLRLNPNNVKIPVIFHNVRGYDAHFMMQEIGKIGKEKNLSINCAPNNIERYMAFMMGQHLVIINYLQLSVYGIKSGQTGSKFAIGQIQIYQPSIPR